MLFIELSLIHILEAKGIEFNYDTARYNERGTLNFIYLKEEIGGFGVHLAGKDS